MGALQPWVLSQSGSSLLLQCLSFEMLSGKICKLLLTKDQFVMIVENWCSGGSWMAFPQGSGECRFLAAHPLRILQEASFLVNVQGEMYADSTKRKRKKKMNKHKHKKRLKKLRQKKKRWVLSFWSYAACCWVNRKDFCSFLWFDISSMQSVGSMNYCTRTVKSPHNSNLTPVEQVACSMVVKIQGTFKKGTENIHWQMIDLQFA